MLISRDFYFTYFDLHRTGCAVNSLDSFGQAPLHYAVSCGHEEVVRLLLSKGADVSIKDEEDCLPLDLAENEEMRRILLAANG